MKFPRRPALLIGLLALAAASCGDGTPTTPAPPASSPHAGPTAPALPSPAGQPTAAPPAEADLPSRIVVADLGIDLPIVSGDLAVAGNPPDYPLCDVAQYLTTYRHPGRPGTTTWIYGHAREGMFLPLLEASERDDGRELVGREVELYTTGSRRYTYRIADVLRHATDRSVARDVPGTSGRLVLQTSEGPSGTVPKLQVVAELVGVAASVADESIPTPSPRVCFER